MLHFCAPRGAAAVSVRGVHASQLERGSRVRVDSLSLRALTPLEFVHMTWRAERTWNPWGKLKMRTTGQAYFAAANRCMRRGSSRLGAGVLAWCDRVQTRGEPIDRSLNATLARVCEEMRS